MRVRIAVAKETQNSFCWGIGDTHLVCCFFYSFPPKKYLLYELLAHFLRYPLLPHSSRRSNDLGRLPAHIHILFFFYHYSQHLTMVTGHTLKKCSVSHTDRSEQWLEEKLLVGVSTKLFFERRCEVTSYKEEAARVEVIQDSPTCILFSSIKSPTTYLTFASLTNQDSRQDRTKSSSSSEWNRTN